jgi:hypothetical protein
MIDRAIRRLLGVAVLAAAAGFAASTSHLAEYFLELVERTGALLSADTPAQKQTGPGPTRRCAGSEAPWERLLDCLLIDGISRPGIILRH